MPVPIRVHPTPYDTLSFGKGFSETELTGKGLEITQSAALPQGLPFK